MFHLCKIITEDHTKDLLDYIGEKVNEKAATNQFVKTQLSCTVLLTTRSKIMKEVVRNN